MIRAFTVFFLCLNLFAGPALALDTRARAAVVIDINTGATLLEKNADTALPPASMSKLMTLYMVFEALKEGRLGLTSKFRVSENAWQLEGSSMFLKAGDSVSIEDLLRGVIVQSGNDACVVLAEGLAGSETEFANRMTKRARQLGFESSSFANSTGLPHPDHVMSARDLAKLAQLIITEFPEYYTYFAETKFTWEGITQENRNPLLYQNIGADGLKTGHTEEAGYGLVGSAVQDERRIVFVVMGLASVRARAEESERIAGWAFREFSTETVFAANAVVASGNVWLGALDQVDLVAGRDISILYPYADRADITAEAIFNSPVEAPISKGDKLATLVITIPGLSTQNYPLFAGHDVEKGSFLKQMLAAGQLLGRRILDATASDG